MVDKSAVEIIYMIMSMIVQNIFDTRTPTIRGEGIMNKPRKWRTPTIDVNIGVVFIVALNT